MRWTEQQANDWYAKTGWLAGFNYVTSSAVNATEMWQVETFDPASIRRELSLAAQYSYNTCRVFLPFLVWHTQRESFMRNLELFLSIAAENNISVMPILFDDCAFAGKEPYMGKQDAPIPGVSNSGWTPSPGPRIADDPQMEPALAAYVHDIIGTYANDARVLVWDLYNEPGGSDRNDKSLPLLGKVFQWARAAKPMQPLTACVWVYQDYDFAAAELSDVVSYHDYGDIAQSEERLRRLRQYRRPLLCTEWLCRQFGNTFASHLPFYQRENIGTYHWGLVLGKTQTNLHWSTMLGGTPEPNPAIWQHDIFHPDYTPYDAAELVILRQARGL